MKKSLFAAAALIALPMAAQAQSPAPGFYIGAEGGLNWLLNTNVTAVTSTSGGALNTVQVTPQTGWMAGGVIGYDFVGPRVELEGCGQRVARAVHVGGESYQRLALR